MVVPYEREADVAWDRNNKALLNLYVTMRSYLLHILRSP